MNLVLLMNAHSIVLKAWTSLRPLRKPLRPLWLMDFNFYRVKVKYFLNSLFIFDNTNISSDAD
jgi:hypothetical protein